RRRQVARRALGLGVRSRKEDVLRVEPVGHLGLDVDLGPGRELEVHGKDEVLLGQVGKGRGHGSDLVSEAIREGLIERYADVEGDGLARRSGRHRALDAELDLAHLHGTEDAELLLGPEDPPPAVSTVVLGARRLLRAADAEKVLDRLTVALCEEDGAGRAGSLRSLLRRDGEKGARGGPWRKTLRGGGK